MSVPDKQMFDFCDALVALCKQYEIANLNAAFKCLIGEASVSHERVFNYEAKENSKENMERARVQYLAVKNLI